MAPTNQIQFIETIEQMHEAMQSPLRPLFSDVHVYKAEHLLPTVISEMRGYKKNFHLITLVLAANYRVMVQGEVHMLVDNQLLFSAQGQTVSWKRIGPWYGYTVFFTPGFAGASDHNVAFLKAYPFFDPTENLSISLDRANTAKLLHLFESMWLEQTNPSPDINWLLRHYLRAILTLSRRLAAPNWQPPDPAFEKLHNYLLHSPNPLQSTTNISAVLGINYRTINGLVKEATGKNIRQLQIKIVLTRAKVMLAHGSESVKEISYSLGFYDPQHFQRFFKQHVSVTPIQFRKDRQAALAGD